MKNFIKISAILGVIALGVSAYIFSPKTKHVIDKYIIGKQEEPISSKPVEPERWIYILADGTGSVIQNTSIPRVRIEWLNELVDKLYTSSGGRVYLSHIDNDSRNNQVVYLPIKPQILPKKKPIRKEGEISFDYSKRIKIWKESLVKIKRDSIIRENNFLESKKLFLEEAEKLLNEKVYVKSIDNQWTDVVGVLNSSFITLANDKESKNVNKYVIGFSDFIQDSPYLKRKLDSIPKDVLLMAVNPIQGSSKKITDKVIEYEHPKRIIEVIFNNKRK